VISSLQLEAFYAVVKLRSFSGPAKELRVSQPALSQRVKNLELSLQTGLIIRDPAGLKPTPAGEKLLRYCQAREQIEQELLQDLIAAHKDKGGTIRIGAFSSVMRSVVMPSVAGLMQSDPYVHIQVQNHEMRDMFSSLEKAEVDLIITSEPSKKAGLVTEFLGYEENVLAESRNSDSPKHIFLDHDADDPTTIAFFKLNNMDTAKLRRRYLDEVYALLDGVRLGYGRSIVPKHIAKNFTGIKILKKYKTLKIPTYLQYFEQPFYASLQKEVVKSLLKSFRAVFPRE
jgi:DNA-binding transcriptional LysR family regulator